MLDVKSDTAGLLIPRMTQTLRGDLWASPNVDASNISNFSGLPGGDRYSYGTFYDIGDYGVWWSSTEESSYNAWYRYLNYYYGYVYVSNNVKRDGYSVRCLRD